MPKDKNRNRLVVSYDGLGTVSESELIHAIIDDIKLFKEKYGTRFYTRAKLSIWATNEHGDPLMFKRHDGTRVYWVNTSHYRPSCLDYDL